jgi:hypothetical protein
MLLVGVLMTSPVPLFPNFAPHPQTKLAYAWTASGRVTEIQAVGANMIPAGCFPSLTGR